MWSLYRLARSALEEICRREGKVFYFEVLASTYERLGQTALRQQAASQAEAQFRKALALRAQLAKARPALLPPQMDLCMAQARGGNPADAAKIKFRQDPGPQNALGLVRIDMPNEHNVYMHDTPMKMLFNQRDRAFSAGCVRVQDVFKLVAWIARYEPGWQEQDRVHELIEGGQASDVTLARQVPVYFTYITAWAEQSGRVEFRPDIYGRDGSREFEGERDPDAPPPPQTLAP